MLQIYKTEYFQSLLREVADFYDKNVSYEVAEKFLAAVDSALGKISRNPYCGVRYNPPETFEELLKLHYRKLLLSNYTSFPYTIYYEIEEDRLVIQSIYHHSRDREKLLSKELTRVSIKQK